MGARLVVAIGLFGLQGLAYVQGSTNLWLLALCGVYLVATAAVLRWSRPAHSDAYWAPGWALTLWVDLTVFGLLQTFQQGGFNYSPLFVLPVLLASVLGPIILALGSAAFGTLVLLFDAFSGDVLRPGQSTITYVQGAITGGGLFLVALLANQLATRLGREQAQARLHRALADAESQVNQLIVTGLSEGVMVMDGQGHIWHANPAACTMLGDREAAPPYRRLMALPGWAVLSGWTRGVLRLGQDDQCELNLPTPTGEPQHVLLRARVIQPTADQATPIDAVCVVFMENLRDIETRVRNEKLAAMGRVSAAVAHEIRNPLTAIAQANALLSEDALSPVQRRLTHMIGQNAQRLGRTVDDILDVAKLPTRPPAPASVLALDATVSAIVSDWQHQHPGGPPVRFSPGAAGLNVRFDPEHLRRVLVNLLDNAHQHAPADSRRVEISTGSPAALEVWNPGPPLPPSVAQFLFEPFTSSHSRSSGLGLYLSRELCLRYGAELSYQATTRDGVAGHAFTVQFRE
ncbi:ATP-binding protein [Tepidicella baoligensis]|uniref:ATP-binding protein n=1 Tax=Tepidicella baoligensis TaxID=2707016 RepID=UPI0015DAD6DA|nr:ATP-binding protein [Tepidicella baoligensis]